VPHLAAPRSPHHRPRRDPIALAVAALAVALVLAFLVSVGSLIDRYVGWAAVGIGVGVISLAVLVGLLRLALTDRRAAR
jgi:predicted MFS family arabinose efflux permease